MRFECRGQSSRPKLHKVHGYNWIKIMKPLKAIKYILSEYDHKVFNEYRKVEALFMDLCIDPMYTQEVNTLLVAVKMRVPRELLKKNEVDELRELALIKQMIDDYGIKRDLAFEAIFTWSDAIHGNMVHKKLGSTLQDLKIEAAKGDMNKQFELGKAYLRGFVLLEDTKEIIEKDASKAFEFFMLAAKSDHVEAKNYLGYCYDQGIGVTKDSKKAKDFYQQSAKQGSLNALYNVANCYEYGIGIAQNESKAFKYYEKLYKKGYVEAIYKLAWFYENGISINEDRKHALVLYREAGEKGSSQAQYYLGQCYQHPSQGEPNINEAKKWYYLAAKNNHPKARFHLSQL